jgi:hypothetical protein
LFTNGVAHEGSDELRAFFLGVASRKSLPLRVRLLRDFLVEAYARRLLAKHEC